MTCPKCAGAVPDGSVFCNHCGKKLIRESGKIKRRGNGQGTAFRSPDGKSWTGLATVYNPDRKTKRKSGFPSKTAALAYCAVLRAELLNNAKATEPMTLKQLYEEWEPWYEPRVKSMAGYKAAFAWFAPLHGYMIDSITVGDLQDCLDACDKGKRTHQMMKVLAGLLWGYAADRKYVEKKITDSLFTGTQKSKKRDALTEKEVELFHNAIGKHRYAEYVYCLCYLGYRPGEMLELRKDQLRYDKDTDIWYFVNGKKTDAGRDRIVTIPDKILPIILDRAMIPGTDLLFPMYVFSRKNGVFLRFKPLSDSYFRESIFKPTAALLGVSKGKVPYSARHTYANKLKKATGDGIDKAALMGHSDYTFTQTQYQTTDLEELNDITKSL